MLGLIASSLQREDGESQVQRECIGGEQRECEGALIPAELLINICVTRSEGKRERLPKITQVMNLVLWYVHGKIGSSLIL